MKAAQPRPILEAVLLSSSRLVYKFENSKFPDVFPPFCTSVRKCCRKSIPARME